MSCDKKDVKNIILRIQIYNIYCTKNIVVHFLKQYHNAYVRNINLAIQIQQHKFSNTEFSNTKEEVI